MTPPIFRILTSLLPKSQKNIESLKTGKANGPDGLSAEYLKLCGNRLPTLISLVFTSMSSHCFIPGNVMKSVIIPLVKDKTGDITDKNNYRPIALILMMSKIIEKNIYGPLGVSVQHNGQSSVWLQEKLRY